ncbi:SusC/RagA family TonB-linked outer membrane protein [Catalinimonas niigatensis]|uniref:SusC/RagA family TonB-linked outer membrane protein n=1 Tax=Catalinimonas niigatensis TaxID=1397264 RepID=UPI0026656FAB|nr:SusC/RagA family TonB-linked outer membrane protein [Catalinimonas niigatensis]WPP49265.1 SusC/RagA family TonB-linked outer membrane protein [Catalinimonas niigatensis]
MRGNSTNLPLRGNLIRKLGTLLLVLVFVQQHVYAQDRAISGTITSVEEGTPVPGVNVIVKGTTKGTVTDIDGNYRISVPENATTLVFSFIGLAQQEVEINGRSTIDVAMESDAKQLSEVVVTAIGIEREKKALGYSVASVGSEKIAQVSEPDPLRAVQGKLPGVNITGGGGAPGQSTKINIRGISSLTGNTQPLFVVDGIPFDNSTNATNPGDPTSSASQDNSAFSNRAFDLDPNNIESMTVLKGAAAAALYGSRATNGVVVITTKAAKKNVRKGLEVTYSGSYNVEQVSNLPDYQDVYAQGSNQLYNAGFIGNWGAPFPNHVDRLNEEYGTNYSQIMYDGVEGVVPATPAGFIPHPLIMTSTGRADRYDLLFPDLVKGYYFSAGGQWITDPNDPLWGSATGTPIGIDVPFQPYDIVGGFFDQGQLVENSINVASGGENVSLTGNVSHMRNTGITPGSEAGRTSLSFGGNGQLENGLFVSGNVTYVNTTQETPQSGGSFFGDYTTANSTSIFQRLYYLPRNYDLNGYPFESPIDGSNVFYRALDNPLWIAKYNRFSSDVNRVYGNITLTYDVGEWLNLTAKGGINTYHDARKDIVRGGGVALPSGRVYTEDVNYTEQDYNFIATVTKDINESFGFRGIVGFNVNQRERGRRKVTGSGIISEGLYNTDATTQTTVNWDYSELRRYYAAYADLQFSYNDYLFVNVVGRNDWSSTLPVENRSYFYPGISASFVVSEAFDIGGNVLDFLKVRAARTQVGNEPSPYLTATYYSILQPVTIGSTDYNRATLNNVLGNVNLKPEFTTETEAGVEAQLFDGRIGIDVTWFNRTSTDQIAQAKLPATSGFDTEWVNIGELQNSGWEIGLDLTPVRTASGFSWNIYSAFTKIETEVIDAGPAGEIFVGGPFSTLGTLHRSGQPYGQIFGSSYARDDEGNLLINKNLGLPFLNPTNDIIGDPNPDFLLGITNTFTYKGFTLRALIDWKQGGDMFSSTAGSLLLRGMLKSQEDREGLRVVPGVYGSPQDFQPTLDENGEKIVNTTAVTAFDYHFTDGWGAYGADEVNVYDATTIRLRELALGYNLPANILESTPFGSVRLMFTGRNLWFKAPNFLEGLNFDPEILAEPAGSNVQGFDYGAFPTTRRYGVNLTVTF